MEMRYELDIALRNEGKMHRGVSIDGSDSGNYTRKTEFAVG